MPAPKIIDEIELHGCRFRLHRIRGFAAFEAKAEWAGVVGEKGAHLLALGADRVVEMTRKLLNEAQIKAFAKLGDDETNRALALLGIIQCMQRERMTAQDMARLAQVFVLGHVDVWDVGGGGECEWLPIEKTDDLDRRLDGSHDGDIWNDLLWRQIPHCLGPTIAVSGTNPGTTQTAKT